MKTSTTRSLTLLVAALSLAVVVSAQAKGKNKASDKAPAETFSVNAATKIVVTGVDSPALSNIQVGDKVSVVYTGTNGSLTATEITDLGTGKTKGDRKGAKHSKDSQDDAVQHAGGIVTSVDSSAQTLTISEKKHKKQQ